MLSGASDLRTISSKCSMYIYKYTEFTLLEFSRLTEIIGNNS